MGGGDISEIVNLVNLYPVAVDTLRFDLFDQIFTDDIRMDFGGPAAWQDLAALKTAFEAIHRPFDATLHLTSNHQVVLQGERANCLSYVHGRFIRQVAEGGNMFESVGWYDDALVRTPAGWRINARSCSSVWAGGNPVVLQTLPGVSGEQKLDSLSRQAAAGQIAYLRALAGKA
jgi:hypothetical protein